MTPHQVAHALVGVLALSLLALWYDAVHRLHRLRELHHVWYGLILCALPWWPCWVVGLVVMADDAMQHHRQEFTPEYLSPLHRLYVWAYRKVMR